MLNGGKQGNAIGAYPGKFGAKSANLANQYGGFGVSNQYGGFGALNQYGGFGTSNQYGGFGNNGMAQLHQLRMGLGALPGRFSQNLAMQNQAIQNQAISQAIPATGGYPLKFGKRLGLSGK
jgi:hypothetical protein